MALAIPAAAQAISVVVLEIPDVGKHGTGKKIREQIVSAFRKTPDMQVIPVEDLMSAARRKHIKPRDVDQPQNLGRLCVAVGSDGAVRGERDGHRIHILVIDRSGNQVWDRSLDVEVNGLKGDTPRRLAKAVSVALAGQESAPGEASSPRRPGRGDDETTAALDETAPERAPVGRSRASAESEPVAPDEEQPRRKKTLVAEREPDEVKPRDEVETTQKAEAAGTTSLVPLLDIAFDFAPVWRSYQFTPSGSGTPSGYSTSVPYATVELGADLFPLHALSNPARGIGVSAHFFQSLLLQSRYCPTGDPVSSCPQPPVTFGSSEQRFGGEILYRLAFQISTGSLWFTARAGWEEHLFSVESNPILVNATRTGLIVGADGSVPVTPALRINARIEIMPASGPSTTEQIQFGAPAAGWGLLARGGLSYDVFVRGGVAAGLFASFDFATFSGKYCSSAASCNGGTVAPNGGSDGDAYYGVDIGVRARY